MLTRATMLIRFDFLKKESGSKIIVIDFNTPPMLKSGAEIPILPFPENVRRTCKELLTAQTFEKICGRTKIRSLKMPSDKTPLIKSF